MINRKKGITLLFLIILLNLALNNTATVESQVISSVQYSDYLIPNTELSWKLKKLEIEAQGYFTHVEQYGYYFDLTNDYSMTQGDVFKIKINTDPDDLSPDSLDYLFTTSETWADFYLNDDLISNDSRDIYNQDIILTRSYLFSTYILPITLTLDDASTLNVFHDYIYGKLEPFEHEYTQETYELETSANSFTIKSHYAEEAWYWYFYETTEIVYNTDWGILSKFEQETIVEGIEGDEVGDYLRIYFLLETENSEARIPYDWNYGILSIFLSSILALIVRKKRKKSKN
ncbi:MAG: hypothetical protein ACTSQF_01595 [Candidatus Heimdallarchaeaceae archaeon]